MDRLDCDADLEADATSVASVMSDEEAAVLWRSFYEDAANHCRQGLTHGGYRIPRSDNADQVTLKYYNLLKRYIEPQRRRVWYSREFTCPQAHEPALRQLIKLIEKGDDINVYQSKELRKPQFKDWLLNDWGVHHLHLGSTLRSDGLIDRTGPLLFARVDPSDVYLLTVGAHGDWTKQEFVRILHRNWPEVMAKYRIHGVVAGPKPMSDDDIGKLRKRRYTGFLLMPDGTLYMGPGGGYSTDGTSTDVVWKRNELLRTCRHLASLVRDHLEVLKRGCAKNGVDLRPPYQFRLQVINGIAHAWEERTDTVLNLAVRLNVPTMSVPYFGKLTSRSHA